MGIEIERKFLVDPRGTWRSAAVTRFRQGYLSMDKERTVRVRAAGDQGYLTIKGTTRGATRREYEYPIPLADAEQLLDELCEKPLIEKDRYKLDHQGLTWEVDEFFGDNQGLIVAEVELSSEDQVFARPDWLREEVTTDPRYYNANLIKHPFSHWGVEQ
jgi:CYTH domain-containing protein